MHHEVICNEHGDGEQISIEKMRVLLLINVPATATESEVKPWLVSRGVILWPEAYSVMSRLHSRDEVLRAWREEGGESSSLLN